MLTFEEARERAAAQLITQYQGPGTFYVAEWGFEDASDYLLLVGAREAIAGNDPSFVVPDDEQILADKRAGILRRVNALDNLDHAWTPVGNWLKAPKDSEGDEIELR